MDTLERVILFDSNENFLMDLDIASFDPTEIEGLDGESRLIFRYPLDETDTHLITEGCFVAIPDLDGAADDYLLFEIVSLSHDDILLHAECNHDYYSLGKGELVTWNTNADSPLLALEPTLAAERWQIGTVEITRTLKRERKNVNPLESIRYIEREWGGEIRFRITITGSNVITRYVDHLERRGTFVGNRFEFGHNLNEFEHTIETAHIITAAYGFGKAGEPVTDPTTGVTLDAEPVTFTDIEWNTANGDPTNKPIGQNWVGDETARQLYGRPDGNGGKLHKFFRYDDSQAETAEGLLWEAWRQVQLNNFPLINVAAKVTDLGNIDPEFTHERARLGDDHFVVADVKGKPIEMKTRIIKLTRYRKDQTKNEVELGNFLPTASDRLVEIEKKVQTVERNQMETPKEDNVSPIDASRVRGIIDTINTKIHSSLGYVYQDENGILILDRPQDQDPQKAMLLSGGSFFLSNSKNADGSFNWRTFGDGDGFIADELIAGTIKTDLIEISGGANFKWNGDNIYILDPDDSQRQIRIGKYNGVEYGIGYTTDGGLNWQTALDFDGFSLTFDQIGGLSQELDDRDKALTDKFKDGGGVNLLRNSTGTAEYDFWTSNDTSRILTTSNNSLEVLGLPTGFYFPDYTTTGDRYIYQEVDVIPNEPYTISFYVNKLNGAAADGGTSQDVVVQIIDPNTGGALAGAAYWQKTVTNGFERQFFTFTPTIEKVRVRVFAYYAAEATVAGLMLNKGLNPYQWTMANGELYNTNVHFDIHGIKVIQRADNKEIQRTVMTPDKFAGYYDTNQDGIMDTANGSVDEVFRMDKDEFVMKKAVVREEITMGQFKIINVNGGGKRGWAFVPIS